MKGIAVLLWLLLMTASGPSAAAPPSRDELDAITARGRELYAYDQAAWHATDAVLALRPREGAVTHYLPRRTAAGWTVSFGRLAEDGKAFIVAYEAEARSEAGPFTAGAVKPPRRDAGPLLQAALAIERARADFQGENRTYNVAVLPAEKGEWWVYLMPAQTKPDIWPLGGDARYRMSADGKRILDGRRLHKSIIETAPADGEVAAGFHTHILSDLPEDTDVFFVLSRRPSVPEYVGAGGLTFEIATDGSISIAPQ